MERGGSQLARCNVAGNRLGIFKQATINRAGVGVGTGPFRVHFISCHGPDVRTTIKGKQWSRTGEQKVLNDFLPAIVSVGILVGVFLFAWISDVRRIQRLNAPELVQSRVPSEIESESVEPLSMSTE